MILRIGADIIGFGKRARASSQSQQIHRGLLLNGAGRKVLGLLCSTLNTLDAGRRVSVLPAQTERLLMTAYPRAAQA